MENLKDKNLVVFHSYKMSFSAWQEAGILERELMLYRSLKPNFLKIIFVSYATDADAEERLANNDFEVIANTNRRSPILYALSVWWQHRHALRHADIIRVNQLSALLAALPVKLRFPKVKLIVRCGFMWSRFQQHKNIFKKMFVAVLEWFGFLLASRIVLTSHADAQYIENRYGVTAKRALVIRNLIDTDLFKPAARRSLKKLCAVGRLGPQKNYESLIEALAGTNYELHIFGQGELRPKLEELVAEHKVNAKFRGVVTNAQLAKELPTFRTFVLASHYEGNPKSLLEAMSSGLPVVVSDIEHHRDIIAHEKNGLLAGTDATSLRFAIERAMTDAALGKRIGVNSREWILKNCSLVAVLKQEIELYASL